MDAPATKPAATKKRKHPPLDVVVGRAQLQVPHGRNNATGKYHRFKHKHGGNPHFRDNGTTLNLFAHRPTRAANWDFGSGRVQLNSHMVKCYKCLYHGHQQLQCALMWCNRCATWGHTLTSCSSAVPGSGGNRRSTVQDDRKLFTGGAQSQSRWRRSLPPAARQSPPP
jgi:hypothetical protein